jgi:hypothetical protein
MRAIIPSLAAPQQGAEFYKWSFPGAPVQVHLYFKVVQGIRHCLTQASTSGNSVSTKGVLLGKIVTPGLPEITGFRPLYTGNPAELEETIAFFRNSGDNLLPVGYFRTHAGDRLALSPEDLSLAETYFPDPNCVFLLIEAYTAGAANAGFFFWDRGKMNGGFYDFCFLEFPFELPLLTTDGQSNAKTDPQPARDSAPIEPLSLTEDPSSGSITPHTQADSESVESHPLVPDLTPLRSATPLPELNSTLVEPPGSVQEAQGSSHSTPKPPRFGRSIRLARAAVLLALASLAGGIFLPQRLAWITGTGKNTEPTPIALKVERQGTDLSVTWNHNSPLVSRAEAGRLTIYDGGTREFPLDKDHIRSGSVVYSPVTAQIRVQMDLQTSDHRVTSESVMVVLNRPGTTTDSLKPVEVQPRRPSPRAPGNAGTGELPGASRAMVRTTREFLPPQQSATAQSQPPELAPPPPVTAINSAPTTVLAPILALLHSQPPTSKTVDTGKQSQVSSPPSEQVSPISTTSNYVPPVPIRQTVPPPLTPVQRSFISRTVLVEIKVFIDASGNVRKTKTLTHANPVLVTAAQSAANLWTFHPARRAGQNVPSEMVLRFKFDPPK